MAEKVSIKKSSDTTLESVFKAIGVLFVELRDLRAHLYGLDFRTTDTLDAAESALNEDNAPLSDDKGE